MVLPVNGSTHLIPAYYSFYRPRKDERLSWPSWLTCNGWLTHISGHPSAAGRAQDRESSPARHRRSTTVPWYPQYITSSSRCSFHSPKLRFQSSSRSCRARRVQALYTEVFDKLRNLVPQFAPTCVRADFEEASVSTFQEISQCQAVGSITHRP